MRATPRNKNKTKRSSRGWGVALHIPSRAEGAPGLERDPLGGLTAPGDPVLPARSPSRGGPSSSSRAAVSPGLERDPSASQRAPRDPVLPARGPAQRGLKGAAGGEGLPAPVSACRQGPAWAADRNRQGSAVGVVPGPDVGHHRPQGGAQPRSKTEETEYLSRRVKPKIEDILVISRNPAEDLPRPQGTPRTHKPLDQQKV